MSDDTMTTPIHEAGAASDMADRAWVLAIDFGTSYTVAASRVGDARPEVIEIGGERRVPSVVLVTPTGEMHVGSAAENLGVSHPGRSVRRPKTRLGEPAPVILGGRAYAVGDLVAEILRDVYSDAVRHHGSEPSEVRLTHPATWNSPRRNQLRSAAVAAGMPEPVLVPEPVAAAISFIDDVDLEVGDRVLVYDLGGGTFDTAALESTVEGFVVIGRPGGDASIGGELFDELIAQVIGAELDPGVYELLEVADDPDWVHANTTLRREARRAKEALSSQPYADVVLPLPTGVERVRVTVERLEEALEPHLAATAEILRDTATAAGLDGAAISAIHLVGGASRTPLVERLVRREFPDVAISRRGDPKSAVALGATHPRATPTSLAQNSGAKRAATVEQPGPPATPSPLPEPSPQPDATPTKAPRPGPTAPIVPPVTEFESRTPSQPPPPKPTSSSQPPPPKPTSPSQPPPPKPTSSSQPPPPQMASPSPAPPKSARPSKWFAGAIALLGLLVAGIVVVVIASRPGDPLIPPVFEEDSNSIGDVSGLLLTFDDVSNDGRGDWVDRELEPGPLEVTTMGIDNAFCPVTALRSASAVDGYDAVQFMDVSGGNLEQVAHEVATFTSAEEASQWMSSAKSQHDECRVQPTVRQQLENGITYDVSYEGLDLSSESTDGDCVGQSTSVGYRAVDSEASAQSVLQIHFIRRCGRAISVVAARSEVTYSREESDYLVNIERVALERVATLDQLTAVVDTTVVVETTPSVVDDAESGPVATHVPDGEERLIGLSLEPDVREIENPFNALALVGHARLSEEQGVTTTTNFIDPVELPRAELLRVQGELTEFVTAVGFLFADEVATVAPEFPGTNFAVVDDAMLDPNGAPRCTNCVGVTFADEQGAFLAGAAAALTSQRGSVGFIGGVSGTGLGERFEAGFTAGARAVNSDIVVQVRYVAEAPDFGGFVDPTGAREIALDMYSSGTDVIYEVAGASGTGVYQAARDRSSSGSKVWAIAADVDQHSQAEPSVRDFILTSTVKRIDNAVFLVANRHFNGEFVAGNMQLTLADEAMSLATTGGFIDGISGELSEFTARIIDGSIVVPTVPDR